MGHYLFIDGEYLRGAYEGTMSAFYDEVPPIDYQLLRTRLSKPTRVYYYDSVDRVDVQLAVDALEHAVARNMG